MTLIGKIENPHALELINTFVLVNSDILLERERRRYLNTTM